MHFTLAVKKGEMWRGVSEVVLGKEMLSFCNVL